MKRMTPLLLVAVLTACGQSETPKQANVPTVDELATEPVRLKELRQQCPLELFQRVVTVSLETQKIVNSLPALDI